MTNERAREVAKKILCLALGGDPTPRRISETETDILAYRDEVLMEVRNRAVAVPGVSGRDWSHREAANNAALEQRRLFRAMLDEMIAETGPAETTAPINTGGRAVVVGCDSPNVAADRDFVLRTLAQAYVGNDYTIEGRKFRDAVERLWRR